MGSPTLARQGRPRASLAAHAEAHPHHSHDRSTTKKLVGLMDVEGRQAAPGNAFGDGCRQNAQTQRRLHLSQQGHSCQAPPTKLCYTLHTNSLVNPSLATSASGLHAHSWAKALPHETACMVIITETDRWQSRDIHRAINQKQACKWHQSAWQTTLFCSTLSAQHADVFLTRRGQAACAMHMPAKMALASGRSGSLAGLATGD